MEGKILDKNVCLCYVGLKDSAIQVEEHNMVLAPFERGWQEEPWWCHQVQDPCLHLPNICWSPIDVDLSGPNLLKKVPITASAE